MFSSLLETTSVDGWPGFCVICCVEAQPEITNDKKAAKSRFMEHLLVTVQKFLVVTASEPVEESRLTHIGLRKKRALMKIGRR